MDSQVTPTKLVVPQVIQASDAAAPPVLNYPVPPQHKSPKHLFHFIIRYEGEGIIDSNVVDLFKNMYSENMASSGPPYAPGPVSAPPNSPIACPPAGLSVNVQPLMTPPTSANPAPMMPPAETGSRTPSTLPPAAPQPKLSRPATVLGTSY